MRALWVVLATTLSTACATTRTTTLVERPAAITLPAGAPVALKVDVRCQEVMVGPDKRRVVTDRSKVDVAGVTVNRVTSQRQRISQAGACSGPTFHHAFVEPLRARLIAALRDAGHAVVAAGKTRSTVAVTLEVSQIRDLELIGQRKEKGKNSACMKLCGTPVCDEYALRGRLEVGVALVGPKIGGRAQSNAQTVHSAALRGAGVEGVLRLACRRDDVMREWRDPSRYDWPGAYQQALADVGQQVFDRSFVPYTESYVLVLFDSGIESSHNVAGLAHADAERWSVAVESFESALADVRPGVDEIAKGRVLHNIAAAYMMADQLDRAHKAVEAALGHAQDRDTSALELEIERRIADRGRRKAAGRQRKK